MPAKKVYRLALNIEFELPEDEMISPMVVSALREHASAIQSSSVGDAADGVHRFPIGETPVLVQWSMKCVLPVPEQGA